MSKSNGAAPDGPQEAALPRRRVRATQRKPKPVRPDAKAEVGAPPADPPFTVPALLSQAVTVETPLPPPLPAHLPPPVTADPAAVARIASLSWAALQKELLLPAEPYSPRELALQAYFGETELFNLRELAGGSRALSPEGSPSKALADVIFLPGIMGSGLSLTHRGKTQPFWINLLRIAGEGIGSLQLPSTGDEVAATDPDHRTYSRTLLALSANWNMHPFGYDWRKDLGEAADRLAHYIERRLADRPVHIVAHSMGGLVARLFIARYPKLWDAMRGPDGDGGKLIMLGTPNYGSYAMVQVLTGAEKLVRWLAKLDLRNSLPEVVKILNTFEATYQMLPAPEKLAPELAALYQSGTWGEFPVLASHLDKAQNFHRELAAASATIDPERMVYIAGCNRRTLYKLDIVAPGEFRYHETLEGDGRVPFSLGLLPDVTTYYVDEDHGSLPSNRLVIKAIHELLVHNRTSALPQHPVITRSITARDGYWHRPIGEDLVGTKLENLAKRVKSGVKLPEEIAEQQAAEEALLRAALGEECPTRRLDSLRDQPTTRSQNPWPLTVALVYQKVTEVATPVLVMGTYRGAPATRRLAQVDEALEYWISQANDHAMLGGELGQISFIPARYKRKLKAKAVLLVSMGEEGRFTHHDLRYLMNNVATAVSSLGYPRFASVVLGTKAGTMSEERALLSLLQGVCDAMQNPSEVMPAKEANRVSHLTLIARDEKQFADLSVILENVEHSKLIDGLDVTFKPENFTTPPTPAPDAIGKSSPKGVINLPSDEAGPRITIERDGSRFRFSALVKGAVIPVREVDVQAFFPNSLSGRLMDSVTREEQETYGQLLTTTLFPIDFQELLAEPLTFILDRETAGLPWEMACFTHERRPGTQYFGPQLLLTRQFRTMLSPRPGLPPPRNQDLRVLIIADPAPEPEYQLPGARREGRAVVQMLSRIKQYSGLDIDVVERIGDAECDPLEILALILNGNFDVVHFAGHGVFNADHPSCGGWVFGKDRFLSAREIFQARQVPRLVFANACFSAEINQGPALTAEELNRNLAGIAEAFFERGVRNYLGTGWPVNDAQAEEFATEFYAQALLGLAADKITELSHLGETGEANPRPLGYAIAEGRNRIAHRGGSTWGAYQHYGQANDVLLSLS
ncbi:CHAT domain-containing protein [Hymenobacter jejuensis]|uniref:CHAT domain-containing protein n=1 Tax=Hymenobacter jejuensis TaxID=2502781 RepID=A0A5B8A5M6_9BACT|nr:CHAT domain-containing protein [Hymenobacter jejuensis]QDA61915.1 CHAT domain-containing protein [Hymenobacter jejuensis]